MTKIIGSPLPSIPWENKPDGVVAPVWRYSGNPIIKRNAIPTSNSIFNSAVIPYKDGYAGVFRCDSKALSMDLFAGFSYDGIKWEINNTPIQFIGEGKNPEDEQEFLQREYRYDPRVCYMDGKYVITWCNGYHGPTIGVGYTENFKMFYQIENAFLPYNRNGVLFPRKIGGQYCMLSRPSDTGHTSFGDIFTSFSTDMVYWGKHRHVMSTYKSDKSAWQSTKIGAGPIPIETDEGWLVYYHGVLTTCNGYVYRLGAVVLDIDKPWVVKMRSAFYLLGPEETYELTGDVPNVIFPCAALTDSETGRITIYYGCADTVTAIAFTTVDETINYIKQYPLV